MKQICTEVSCEFFQAYKWCKAWERCPCGKEGHENGASVGYSIGECKMYDPIEIARQYAPKFDKPVVDAVEVVRCKDCKHRPVPNGNNHPLTPKPSEFEWDETCPYVCGDEWHNEMPDDNDFCSRGERKEVEE